MNIITPKIIEEKRNRGPFLENQAWYLNNSLNYLNKLKITLFEFKKNTKIFLQSEKRQKIKRKMLNFCIIYL